MIWEYFNSVSHTHGRVYARAHAHDTVAFYQLYHSLYHYNNKHLLQ